MSDDRNPPMKGSISQMAREEPKSQLRPPRAVSRFFVYLAVFGVGTVFGASVERYYHYQAELLPAVDPKRASEDDRQWFLQIMRAGYGTLEAAANGAAPVDPGRYLDLLLKSFKEARTRSQWAELRLCDEIVRVNRPEAVIPLLRMADNDQREWFKKYVRECATRLAIHVPAGRSSESGAL